MRFQKDANVELGALQGRDQLQLQSSRSAFLQQQSLGRLWGLIGQVPAARTRSAYACDGGESRVALGPLHGSLHRSQPVRPSTTRPGSRHGPTRPQREQQLLPRSHTAQQKRSRPPLSAGSAARQMLLRRTSTVGWGTARHPPIHPSTTGSREKGADGPITAGHVWSPARAVIGMLMGWGKPRLVFAHDTGLLAVPNGSRRAGGPA